MAIGFKEKVERELSMLSDARRNMMKRMHYSTVDEILRKSGLPYQLCQTVKNDVGEFISGYRYYFTSDWGSDSALYIRETFAGRLHTSMGKALDTLEYVLKEAIRRDRAGLPDHRRRDFKDGQNVKIGGVA